MGTPRWPEELELLSITCEHHHPLNLQLLEVQISLCPILSHMLTVSRAPRKCTSITASLSELWMTVYYSRDCYSGKHSVGTPTDTQPDN